MRILALVAAGGAIGSVARYLVGVGAARMFAPGFPIATVIVNVAGSAIMGLLAVLIASRFGNDPALRAFFLIGILGGFTTFSAFSMDAVALMERGALGAAAVYVGASVVLSLAAFSSGAAIGRMLTS